MVEIQLTTKEAEAVLYLVTHLPDDFPKRFNDPSARVQEKLEAVLPPPPPPVRVGETFGAVLEEMERESHKFDSLDEINDELVAPFSELGLCR